MAVRRIAIALIGAAVVLTGCGDGESPDLGDLPSGSPTRSLIPSELPSRPGASASIEPSRTAEPTKSTAEPTKSTAEPTKSTAEPTKSTAEPTKSTAEPTKSTAEPTKSTAEPTTTEPSTAPSPSGSTEPTAQPSESTPWWPWLLLLVLAIAGGVIWWVLGRRRRVAAWQSDFDATTSEARWLVEQPVSSVLEAPTSAQMSEAWSQVSTTISSVDRQLYLLRDTAPNVTAQQRLDTVRGALDGLRVALLGLVEAARAEVGADVQRQRTVAVEAARASVRRATDGTTA